MRHGDPAQQLNAGQDGGPNSQIYGLCSSCVTLSVATRWSRVPVSCRVVAAGSPSGLRPPLDLLHPTVEHWTRNKQRQEGNLNLLFYGQTDGLNELK